MPPGTAAVHTILDRPFADQFGITQEELRRLFAQYGPGRPGCPRLTTGPWVPVRGHTIFYSLVHLYSWFPSRPRRSRIWGKLWPKALIPGTGWLKGGIGNPGNFGTGYLGAQVLRPGFKPLVSCLAKGG